MTTTRRTKKCEKNRNYKKKNLNFQQKIKLSKLPSSHENMSHNKRVRLHALISTYTYIRGSTVAWYSFFLVFGNLFDIKKHFDLYFAWMCACIFSYVCLHHSRVQLERTTRPAECRQIEFSAQFFEYFFFGCLLCGDNDGPHELHVYAIVFVYLPTFMERVVFFWDLFCKRACVKKKKRKKKLAKRR